ncbi:MAG TPA: hypothetical protein V6C88_19165, partial [Chroococcidiopsis sp.]
AVNQPIAPTVVDPGGMTTSPSALENGAGSIGNIGNADSYLVVVNGNSPLLLEQVRSVESGAFVQNYDGRAIIQAGRFSEPTRANQQAAALASQGIGAEVVVMPGQQFAAAPYSSGFGTSYSAADPGINPMPLPDLLPATPVPREVTFGQDPNFSQFNSNNADNQLAQGSLEQPFGRSYYVVIPGRSADLGEISRYVTQLSQDLIPANANAEVIQELSSPLGPHVLVGPFVSRSTAGSWSQYFRGLGLSDARVYYRR